MVLLITVVVCLVSLSISGATPRPDTKIIGSLFASRVNEDASSCPDVNPEHPIFLPHPEDCRKFYICDSGSSYLSECQSGLHFNRAINACDFPQNAGCETDYIDEPKGKNVHDDSDQNQCPVENSEHPVYLPHPTDCNKFYVCDSGVAHLKECQRGLHFSKKINACDYPNKAGCDSDDGHKPKGKIIDDFSSCPAENQEHPVFLPHPVDCNKFYVCDSGSAHLKECQPGLHFNKKIKACDYPRNAGCRAEMAYKGPGVPSPYCPPIDGKIPVYFRHRTNCTVYYMCSHGKAYEFICPAKLHFNFRNKLCDYEEFAKCRTFMF